MCSMLYQHKFLTALLERLDKEPSAVVNDLNKIRSLVIQSNSMSLHVAADWHKMNEMNIDLTLPFQSLCKEFATTKDRYKVLS